VPEDEQELLARLAALEEEVKDEADAKRARKEAALERQREALRAKQDEQETLRERAAVREKKKRRDADDDELAVDKALAVAAASRLARSAKKELTRPTGEHEKSMLISGGVSLLFGPLGWLYAGSWREAVPASAAWILLAGLASKILPMFLLMPVLLVVMPVSAIAGFVYAWQYNKSGERTRLFDKDKDKDGDKLLPPGKRR
jgi:hypothetical protein